MQQAKEEGKINIIKTWASSSLPNVAKLIVPDMLTTRRPCEPAACLRLFWPVVKAWPHFLTLPRDGGGKQGHIRKVSHLIAGRREQEYLCVSDKNIRSLFAEGWRCWNTFLEIHLKRKLKSQNISVWVPMWSQWPNVGSLSTLENVYVQYIRTRACGNW